MDRELITIPPEDLETLREMAKNKGVTVSELIREAISYYLKGGK